MADLLRETPAAGPDYKNLPRTPGVYLMRSADSTIIYIGKAKNLAARVAQYFQSSRAAGDWKTVNLAALIRAVDYIPCESERDALLLERELIRRHQPFFNAMWKDGKSYPCIKISTDEDFPRVFITRGKTAGGSCFGPYPNSSLVKNLLRYFWRNRLLPLRPCKWEFSVKKPLDQKKINACLYYHTGQCPAPCAGKISRPGYRRIVRRAAALLAGGHGKMLGGFRKKMETAAARRQYEEAALYRDLARALGHMEERVKISRYSEPEVEAAISQSSAAARLARVIGLRRPPVHIEGFDTSNLFGKSPVGSMVCFTAGRPNHAHYRRFKIRTPLPEGGSDDFAMIAEIVGRRLSRLKTSGEPLPDLLLIDGGMGQLAYAARAASRCGACVPLVSLAKKNEEIFIPGRREPVRLDRADPALRLLMAIRDEAHRFGIRYHRYLRSKNLLKEK